MALHGDLARLRRLWRPIVVRKYLQNTSSPSLHIGCGAVIFPGWLNVDRYNKDADTYLDARNRFPFSDDTFDSVFSEHMIEHLDITKVKNFLCETFRVMKPKGELRLSCPDLEIYSRSYIEGDDEFFERLAPAIRQRCRKKPELGWLVRSNGAAFMTGVVKPFHGHRWMFDFETLRACLEEVGFTNCRKCAFGLSGTERLSGKDSPDREFESLYVEASKQ